MRKPLLHQLGAAVEHEGGISVRRMLEVGVATPFYLVTLVEEPAEVESTVWDAPRSNLRVKPPRRAFSRLQAREAEGRHWEVQVRLVHRRTGLMTPQGEIVDELWQVSPAELLALEGCEFFGTAGEALEVTITALRAFDAKRRMTVNLP